MNKYHARKTFSELCQRQFDSKAECIRAEELTLLEKAGEVAQLEYQPKFVLCEKPKITYTADFRYLEDIRHIDTILYDGTVVVEDCKPGVLTRDTRTKLAWLKEKFGIDVLLTGKRN